jgi:hypothetical protein
VWTVQSTSIDSRSTMCGHNFTVEEEEKIVTWKKKLDLKRDDINALWAS